MPSLPDKIAGFRATVINELIDYCASLAPIRSKGIKHNWTGRGISYQLSDADNGYIPDDDKTFGTSVAGLKCTVRAGTLRIHSASIEAEYAGGTVDLAGNPCWVYVNYPRGGSTITIQVSSTKPVSDTSTLRVPLCKCTPNAAYTAYSKEFTNHDGDINLDSPLS